MKELNRFRQFLTEGVIKENISSHKEEAKRFLEKFVDDNEDKFEFIPDLETGYIDANDNSYNVDELASIFLDIGQDIPRGTHNQKYKGEGGTYVVVSEGVIKEDMSIEDVYNDAQKQVKDIYDIDVPMNVVKQWADNYQFPYSREVDPEDEDQYILVYDFGTEERGDFMEWLKDNNLREGTIKEDEQFVGNDINANKLLNIFTEYLPTSHYHQDKTLSYDEALNMVTEFVKFTGMDSTGEDFLNHIMDTEGPIKEDARTDAEQEGYKDGFDDAKDDVKDALSKMKVSELKAKIKEQILAELTLSEADEEVDVDIDVEDEVEVEAGADDIEIERPGVKATVNVGLSPEEEIVQDSLKAAMDAAQALGSDKLADQIGNTITFFTRQFVVGDNTD